MIAPANTGSDRSRRMAVILAAQTKRGTRSSRRPLYRILITVVMKFKAPKIDETPAIWREKIARSTEGPAWAILEARGGYTVHPVPTPFSTALEDRRRIREGGSSQNLMLLRRGNAMSGAPNIRGISQFPNPPTKIGITRKKIIKKAWAVTIVL